MFIPAFKVRDLTVIYRLATTFTKVQPELDLMPLSDDLPSSRMEGAVMRWEDARELAELVLCSLTSHSHPGSANPIRKSGQGFKYNPNSSSFPSPHQKRGSLISNGVKDTKPAPLKITSRQLVWLPFYENGIYLRDALLNVGILKGKIHSPKLSSR